MSDTLSLQQRRQVHEGAVRLHREFAGVFGVETIERLLADSLDRLLSDARVMVFVPLLAERFARERLHSAAKSKEPG